MGFESLQGCRYKAKLKRWYKPLAWRVLGTCASFLGKFGILNHVQVARGSLGVR